MLEVDCLNFINYDLEIEYVSGCKIFLLDSNINE